MRVLAFLFESSLLATFIYLEQHPNVYIERLLFIGRVWAFFFALVAWVCVLGFAMGVPSPRVANNAVRTSQMSIFKRLSILQDCALIFFSLMFGRWWFFLCYTLFVSGGFVGRSLAKRYLTRVRINKKTQHAIIEVN